MEKITQILHDNRYAKSVSDETANALYEKLGYRMSIEHEVSAAAARVQDGIKRGDYHPPQAEDIYLILDFMNETLRKTAASLLL